MKPTLLILASAFMLAACGASKPVAPSAVPLEYAGKKNPFSADAATAGAEVFHTNCETCHGAQGHGDGPASAALNPKPKNLAEFVPTVQDDYLFWRISTGKDGTSMPPWKGVLTTDQIWQVITYIRTLK